jgi:dihydrofolate reductase
LILSIIVAMEEGGGIGLNNRLPWHLPDDLKRFKMLTMGHYLILGRRTYESLPRRLEGRRIIVVSENLYRRWQEKSETEKEYSKTNDKGEIVIYQPSLRAVLEMEEIQQEKEVFVGGGARLFYAALPCANRMYLTLVKAHLEADVYFPVWDKEEWKTVYQEHHERDEKHAYAFEYVVLERKG